MERVVVLFTKPFGAYAKGYRAGFDADAGMDEYWRELDEEHQYAGGDSINDSD